MVMIHHTLFAWIFLKFTLFRWAIQMEILGMVTFLQLMELSIQDLHKHVHQILIPYTIQVELLVVTLHLLEIVVN